MLALCKCVFVENLNLQIGSMCFTERASAELTSSRKRCANLFSFKDGTHILRRRCCASAWRSRHVRAKTRIPVPEELPFIQAETIQPTTAGCQHLRAKTEKQNAPTCSHVLNPVPRTLNPVPCTRLHSTYHDPSVCFRLLDGMCIAQPW